MKAVYIGEDVRTSEIVTLAIHLRWRDVTPQRTTSAEKGLVLIEEEVPDIVLVHPDFTDMTLQEAIMEIRRFSNVPLIVVSHERDEMELVTSIEVGADDYIRLPCDLTQIMVRIWALLRRVGHRPSDDNGGPIKSGELLVDPATYQVYLEKKSIRLTATEFRLLHLLIKNRGTVVAHEVLERSLWDDGVDSGRLVKKYVQRLRKKLEDNAHKPTWIASVHGVGYRFIGPAPESNNGINQMG